MGNKTSSSARAGEEGGTQDDSPRRRPRSSKRGARSKNTLSCPDLAHHGLDVTQGTPGADGGPVGENGETAGGVGEVKVYRAEKSEVKRHVMLPAEPDVDIKVGQGFFDFL